MPRRVTRYEALTEHGYATPPRPVGGWVSNMLCWSGFHKLDNGPGYCCSNCSTGDDAQHGRLARRPDGVLRYLPSMNRLPEGYRWIVRNESSF